MLFILEIEKELNNKLYRILDAQVVVDLYF